MKYHLTTDGSAYPYSNCGGWAYVIHGDTFLEGSGSVRNSGSNRMELQAVIEGLRILPEGCTVNVYTDSNFVIIGARKRRHSTEPAWQALFSMLRHKTITFIKVSKHSNDSNHGRAHHLARLAVQNEIRAIRNSSCSILQANR